MTREPSVTASRFRFLTNFGVSSKDGMAAGGGRIPQFSQGLRLA